MGIPPTRKAGLDHRGGCHGSGLHGRDDHAPLFRAVARFEKLGRVHRPRMTDFSAAKRRPRNPWDRQAIGVPNFSYEAAFLLDAMEALPRRWVSGGAPTLPCVHERAAARSLKFGRKGFEVGTGDGSAVEAGEFFAVGDRLDFLAQAFRDSFETDFQRFEDVLLLGEDQTLLATFLATFLAELFGE